MKKYKKIGMGLGPLLLFLAFTIGISGKALAVLGITDSQIRAAAAPSVSTQNFYYLGDGHHIEANFGSTKVTFTDNGAGYYFFPPSGDFCKPTNNNSGVPDNYIILHGDANNPKAGDSINIRLWSGGSTNANCAKNQTGIDNVKIGYKSSPPPSSQPGYLFTSDSISTIKDSDFSFTDGSQIGLAGLSPNPIVFTDKNPEDTNHNFAPPANTFCGGGNGITFNGADIQKDPIPATFQLSYYDLGNFNKCTSTTLHINIANPNMIATKILVWNQSNVQTLQSNITLVPQQVSGTASKTVFIKTDSPGAVCGGGWLLVLNSDLGTSGTLYDTQVSGATGTNSSLPNCSTIAAGENVLIGGRAGSTVNASGTTQSCTGNSCPSANASDCSFNSSLDWIICPILQPISDGADTFNGYVSGQLNFDVKGNLENGAVQKAWIIFKDIVSALLVIVMLIMIISQAAGDVISAYTFKKLLPRLVVAVIAMQLSWYICIYLIQLANDLGRGIAELMAAPFGGLTALELPNLVHNLNLAWVGGVDLAASAITLVAIFSIGPIILWGWPIILLAAILIILALIAALATLLFRNALIIILVILAPLGILAWVLPGSSKLWKMWESNFTKLLMFFPLVMALIYGGRIFSWVAGGLGSSGPLDLIMVFIGFFGPYFLLPKSFKWGGDLLSKASNAVNSSWPIKKGREVAKKNSGKPRNEISKTTARPICSRAKESGGTQSLLEKLLAMLEKLETLL